jgi:hypothetical protein
MGLEEECYGGHWEVNYCRDADRMHPISVTVAQRLKVLHFWAKHDLGAALDAFGVSRRSLHDWQKAYRQSKGNTAALGNQSRAPIKSKHTARLWHMARAC